MLTSILLKLSFFSLFGFQRESISLLDIYEFFFPLLVLKGNQFHYWTSFTHFSLGSPQVEGRIRTRVSLARSLARPWRWRRRRSAGAAPRCCRARATARARPWARRVGAEGSGLATGGGGEGEKGASTPTGRKLLVCRGCKF